MVKMGSQKATLYHHGRTVAILALSVVLLPFSSMVTLVAFLIQAIRARSKDGPPKSQDKLSTCVLVTGVGMAKGLFLARTMHLGGCRVLAADFDNGHGNFHCGRFSNSASKFYTLKNPIQHGTNAYISQVGDIIRHENVQLWISCSGVATAIEDAQLAEKIEKSTSCKAFQLNEQAVSILDNKMSFMQKTSDLALSNLEWYSVDSFESAQKLVFSLRSKVDHQATKYIVKCASMDDATRGALPILSNQDFDQMQSVLCSLDYANGKIWVVQEFVESGEEYCTQAVVVNGRIKAFTACRSESILMHYSQLDPQSILFDQMLRFTKQYVSGLENKTGSITGHLSFDFLIRYQNHKDGFIGSLAPIECNPRCHTATVLFHGSEKQLAECYLSAITPIDSNDILRGSSLDHPGYYWIAHDLVAEILGPLLAFAQLPSLHAACHAISRTSDAIVRMLKWQDPTFEWWDPLPWFVLNHIYWPVELVVSSWKGIEWEQLNVSTTKIFKR